MNVTDTRTDRRTDTPWWHRPRLHSIALQKGCRPSWSMVSKHSVHSCCTFTRSNLHASGHTCKIQLVVMSLCRPQGIDIQSCVMCTWTRVNDIKYIRTVFKDHEKSQSNQYPVRWGTRPVVEYGYRLITCTVVGSLQETPKTYFFSDCFSV